MINIVKKIDLTGHVYGRLTVISEAPKRAARSRWDCLCECGVKITADANNLRSGNTRSCGCFQRELIAATGASSAKHGMHRSKTYLTWVSMIQRCTNPEATGYERYGGRGIQVCARWHTFSLFFEDMGVRPLGMTLDRIDNDGDYEFTNCKWSNRFEQSRNKRNNVYLTLGDKTLHMAEWSRLLGIPVSTLSGRLKYGWTVERALTK